MQIESHPHLWLLIIEFEGPGYLERIYRERASANETSGYPRPRVSRQTSFQLMSAYAKFCLLE
jgi:hypothetical protein